MFTNLSRELFTSETESEIIVACVRRRSSVAILFESAIDRAGQVSENAVVRTRGVRGGPFHRFQSERERAVCCCQLRQREHLYRLYFDPGFYADRLCISSGSARTRLACERDEDAGVAATTASNVEGWTDEGGKHEPLLWNREMPSDEKESWLR